MYEKISRNRSNTSFHESAAYLGLERCSANQDVQSSELVDRPLHESLDELLVRDITG